MNGKSLTGRALMAFAMAAASAFAVPASAAAIVVLDRNLPREVKVTGTDFEVDEGTARARIAVDLYDESFEGNLHSESVAVPGLTFDRERREVLFEVGGSTVTCAIQKKILWAATYPQTGACRITVRNEPRTADDGFQARAVTGWVVELKADEPTRSAGLKR